MNRDKTISKNKKLMLLVGFSGKQFGVSMEHVQQLVDMKDLKWERKLLHDSYENAEYRGARLKVLFPFGKCCLVSMHINDEKPMFSVLIVRKGLNDSEDIFGMVVENVYGVVKASRMPETFKKFDISTFF